jgi:hypothetical protein
MRVVAIVIFVMLVGSGVVALIGGVLAFRRRAVIASAPPEALVTKTDSLPVAKARKEAYARHRKAIRLLGEVRRHDDTMTFLPIKLREEIDEAVDEFYKG